MKHNATRPNLPAGVALAPIEKLALLIVDQFEEALLSIECLLAEEGEHESAKTRTAGA